MENRSYTQKTGNQEDKKRSSRLFGNLEALSPSVSSDTDSGKNAFSANPISETENQTYTETRTDRLENNPSTAGLSHPARLKPDEDAFFIKSKDFYIKICHSDILAVEASRNYCTFYLKSGRTECAICSLRYMEDILPSPTFLRINRSIILNIKAVDRICGNMLFIGNKNFTVGPSFREEIFSYFRILRSSNH